MRLQLLALIALSLGASLAPRASAQTLAPIIMQATTPIPAGPAARPPAAPAESVPAVTLQQLQEMEATNAATIKKQEAALATLDELQKAAEELKIFSKRG